MEPPAPTREPLLEIEHLVLVDEPLDAVLGRVAQAALRAVPGAEEVSVTLVEADRPLTAASTGPLALAADEMQYERGFGPCLDAGRTGQVLVIDDMAAETRWPSYAAEAVRAGVGSSVSLPLPIQDERIGALNVYARRPHAFDAGAVAVARQVAAYVAVAVHNARVHQGAAVLARQLQEAMTSRAAIEQAKGAVMALQQCSEDDAIARLIRASQNRNVKLRTLAVDVVAAAAAGHPLAALGL